MSVLGALLCCETRLTFFSLHSGGKSHCGYSDVVHESLMTVGEQLHLLFGEPSEYVHDAMLDVGNYFQEVSYAARDLYRGRSSVLENTSENVDEGSAQEVSNDNPE